VGKALLVIIVFALVVYGALRLIELRKARRTGRPRTGPASSPPRRPLAPDDDPNFLRDLEQRRRREQHERDQRGTQRGTPPPKKPDDPTHDDESEAS
jgi:hypothetical protein